MMGLKRLAHGECHGSPRSVFVAEDAARYLFVVSEFQCRVRFHVLTLYPSLGIARNIFNQSRKSLMIKGKPLNKSSPRTFSK